MEKIFAADIVDAAPHLARWCGLNPNASNADLKRARYASLLTAMIAKQLKAAKQTAPAKLDLAA